MIISGGVNIYPREIEDALILHPAVEDVAVFGVPNPDFGEEVKAVVQPALSVTQDADLVDELMAFANSTSRLTNCLDPSTSRMNCQDCPLKVVQAPTER